MATRKPAKGKRAQAIAANSRKRRKRRTGKKTIHYILLLLFLLAAGVVLSTTTLFQIEKVVVVGADRYTDVEIARTSGIQEGDNLFRVNGWEVEERILAQFPYVESVALNRKLPSTIELSITHSAAAAAIVEEEEIILITREGKVLERGGMFVPTEIPVVKGLQVGRTRPGELLGDDSWEGLRMLTNLFKAQEESAFGEITNVDLTDRLNMTIVYENRYLLLLGSEADLPYKLDFVADIIAGEPPDGEGLIDATEAANKKVRVKDITLVQAMELMGRNEEDQEPIHLDEDGNPVEPEETAGEDGEGDHTGDEGRSLALKSDLGQAPAG